MGLKLLGVAGAATAAALALPAPAVAQQELPWFFCYVDPPTYGRGTFVYTRVNYIGGAAIPQGAILSAMAAENPQVSGRQPTCWRYASQAEAEDRRQKGMAGDRSRNYTVREIGWTSPYSPPPPAPLEVAAPAAPLPASDPAATAKPRTAAAPDRLAVGSSKDAAAKPAAKAAAAATATAKTPVKKTSADEEYERKLQEYNRQKAENDRQQAEYVRALQSHQQQVADLSAQAAKENEKYKQQQQEYERKRAQWEADAAACRAGDASKCATPQQ